MNNHRRLLNFAKHNDVLENTDIQKLVLAAGFSENEQLQNAVSNAILGKAIQHINYPFVPLASQGSITVGKTFNGFTHTIPVEALTKHLLAVGQTGSGKTTLFYNLYEEVDRPAWFFDMKQDYRHLIQEHDELLVLPWSQFRFNPLKPPPGVPPRRWAQVFSEIFGHSTSLLSGSKNYLMKRLVTLYRLYGLFDVVEPPYPSLFELQTLIRTDRINYVRKTANYRDTVQNRIEAMTQTAGSVFRCSQGYDLEELLARDVVFEFDGLGEDVQNFLMEVLIAAVYEYRLAQNHRGDTLRHLFFMDEGKQIFSVYKERQDAAGLPTIDELTAKMREFGEGLIVADQEASKLTDSIKANTYTKFLLSTGDRKQFDAMTESMHLSSIQQRFAEDLDVGDALIQVGGQDPAPVRLDQYDLAKTITDRELRQQQAPKWNELRAEPCETTADFEAETGTQGDTEQTSNRSAGEDGRLSVSESGKRLLEDVVDHPGKPLTQRYDLFDNVRKGNKVKDRLVDQGVVFERTLHTDKGQTKLLELTEKGRDYVEENLDSSPAQTGRGGVEHQYWQRHIAAVFEQAGWTVSREQFDADVYVNMGSTELAIEIALGDNPREIEHVRKHLEKGFIVWVVAPNQEILERLRQRVREESVDRERLRFTPLSEFSNLEQPSE